MSTDHYFGEIVPADVPLAGAEVVPVDPPEPARPDPVQTVYATPLHSRTADRRPIVPAYLRSRDDARAVARWLARYGAHVTVYHATRAPLYALRLAWRSPRGAVVALVALLRWVFDAEGAPLRRDAVHRASADEYLKLTKVRNGRVKRRGLIVGAALAVPAVAVVVILLWRWATTPEGVDPAPLVPWWAFWGAVILAVAVLGIVGTPADKRVTDVVVVSASAPPRLTADVVTRALSALGIAAMTAKGATIGFPAPITRDGPGWRADVDLPFGATVADVVERRDRLASGLRRPLGCVWPELAAEAHAGRLVLWVGDQDMAAAKPRPWTLAKGGTADLFKPVPFGADQRGRPVSVPLMFANVLIGAMPRFGKTFALRVLVLAAALDPRAELRIFELKGTGDLSPVEGCCHHYASGADDATLEAAMASLREVYAELNTRAATIRRLPRQVCPENKVTPELAGRRDLGLFPLVVAIDECQELFSHPDFKDEADRLATAIIKRGPALGIIFILATQRPDAKSLPTGVSANVGIRFCLRVMGQTENDMVLGTSSYKNGLRATTFGPRDKGIGYLVGATDDPQIVRSAYIDAPTAEVIANRARAAREAAGTLSGHAAGEAPPLTPAASLLDDLRVAFATIETDKVWSETVCERLAELRPELYGGWTPDALAAAVKPLGITTAQVWGTDASGTGRNRRGLSREAVMAAVEARGAARREIGS
jgi:S-DNA-T family DNA segregation ATPase FtsK/SpoIIIE